MALGGALFELESILCRAGRGADRLVDHGMVVGPAGRAACRGIRAAGQEATTGKACSARALVRLCRDAFLQDRGREGQEPGSDQAGEGAGGRGVAARGCPAARQDRLSRRRPRADGDDLHRRGASAEGRSGQRLHGRQGWCLAKKPRVRWRIPAARWSTRPDRRLPAPAKPSPACGSGLRVRIRDFL